MTWRKKILGGCFLTLVLLIGAGAASPQDEPQEGNGEKPKPAGRTYPLPTVLTGEPQDDNGVLDTTNVLKPDNTPLTGVQNATLGIPEIRHNYWVPGIQYSSQIQFNSTGQGNTSSWFANNFVSGNLSLLESWSRSQLAVNYSGGGFFSTDSSQGGGFYHQLAVSQSFQWERWQLQLLDQFSYLPQSEFGFGGGTSLGIPGVGGALGAPIPGLGGNYLPNQSIYAALGSRYSNTSVVQTTYQLSPRRSITASGSYGLLDFVNPGNINYGSVGASLGYNYEYSRYSTIGVQYHFSTFHFEGEAQAFGSHAVNLAYGRKLTGRLALQLLAGPTFTTFRVPVNGISSQVGTNASANLTFGFQNGGIGGGYLHGLTGGGGVLTGSTIDQVNFGASRRLTRVWSGNVTTGYAHNKAVLSGPQSTGPSYNSVFAGGGVSRPLGRNVNFALSYQATIYTQSGCTGTGCRPDLQYITLNFLWHTRPFVLP